MKPGEDKPLLGMKRTLQSFVPWFFASLFCLFLIYGFYPAINPYYQSIFLIAMMNIILATSLTLINGFTGQFSLGHAGFMAVGGYCAAALTTFLLPQWGLASYVGGAELFFLLSLVAGGLMAAIGGYIVGLPSLRLKGDYLAIVTLGFGEIIRVVLLNIDWLGGARGLSGIVIYTNQMWLVLGALACSFCAFRFLGTPTGRGMFSVREDEVAAEAMGVNTTRVKVRAFVIGAFWAGVAGGLYAHQYGYLSPTNFNFMKSFDAVVIIVLGGLGSVSGAILAAIALSILPEALRPLQQWTGMDFRMIIYSLILILFMVFKPNGLLGRHELWHFFRKVKK
jgi:branched-chain amino acid transport system permease protein